MIDFIIKLFVKIALLFRKYFTSLTFERIRNNVREKYNYTYWRKRLKALGDDVLFYKYVIIHSPENVSIGSHSRIGDYVLIWGGGS